MSDPVELGLRELARDLHVDVPADLEQRVLARVASEPLPKAGRRLLRWLAGLLVALLGVGVVASPVGATIREWFGFHGVVVSEEEPSATGDPVVPTEPSGLSLSEATRLAGFGPHVPELLGAPDGISVSADRRLVSLTWGRGAQTVRLDQFAAELAPHFWKASRDFELVQVLGGDALWFPTSHDVAVLRDDGTSETFAPRLAAQTLVWPRGAVTLRLEGALTKEQAVELAESAG